MYSKTNTVTINDIEGYDPTTLSGGIDADDTTINLTSELEGFGTFENVSVASTNPGYIQIGSEADIIHSRIFRNSNRSY